MRKHGKLKSKDQLQYNKNPGITKIVAMNPNYVGEELRLKAHELIYRDKISGNRSKFTAINVLFIVFRETYNSKMRNYISGQTKERTLVFRSIRRNVKTQSDVKNKSRN